jgi:hypothetical protein
VEPLGIEDRIDKIPESEAVFVYPALRGNPEAG